MIEKTEQHADLDCDDQEVGDKLFEFVSGQLNIKDRRLIEEHLSHCQACQLDLEMMTVVRKARHELFDLYPALKCRG